MTGSKVLYFAIITSALFIAPSTYATTNSSNDAMQNNQTKTSNPSDSKITSDVKSKLAADNLIANADIKVMTNNGVVTLIAELDNDAQATRAVELTESVNGVTDTNSNNLKVKSSQQPIMDSYITAKVKGSFLREKLFGSEDIPVTSIKVETNNGIVYLIGIVDTAEEAAKAVEIAKSVNGVKNVDSKLEVKSKV